MLNLSFSNKTLKTRERTFSLLKFQLFKEKGISSRKDRIGGGGGGGVAIWEGDDVCRMGGV